MLQLLFIYKWNHVNAFRMPSSVKVSQIFFAKHSFQGTYNFNVIKKTKKQESGLQSQEWRLGIDREVISAASVPNIRLISEERQTYLEFKAEAAARHRTILTSTNSHTCIGSAVSYFLHPTLRERKSAVRPWSTHTDEERENACKSTLSDSTYFFTADRRGIQQYKSLRHQWLAWQARHTRTLTVQFLQTSRGREIRTRTRSSDTELFVVSPDNLGQLTSWPRSLWSWRGRPSSWFWFIRVVSVGGSAVRVAGSLAPIAPRWIALTACSKRREVGGGAWATRKFRTCSFDTLRCSVVGLSVAILSSSDCRLCIWGWRTSRLLTRASRRRWFGIKKKKRWSLSDVVRVTIAISILKEKLMASCKNKSRELKSSCHYNLIGQGRNKKNQRHTMRYNIVRPGRLQEQETGISWSGHRQTDDDSDDYHHKRFEKQASAHCEKPTKVASGR